MNKQQRRGSNLLPSGREPNSPPLRHGSTNNGPGVESDNLFSSTGFTQLVKDPANLEPNKRGTCIDSIFASQPNLIIDSGVHPSLVQTCHHQIIFAKVDLKFFIPPPYEREVLSYNHANHRTN